ncbi:MAG TPA: hypothetical protein VGB53_13540 [Rubricoccaceae bacterium]|jgi:hypothetical protein
MAHHIAELMERVERAALGPDRDQIAAACRTAILDAWSKRHSWPYGAPLERVAVALSAIAGPPDDTWAEKDRPEPDEWFALLSRLETFDYEERRIVLDVGVASMDLEADRADVDAAGDELEDREREMLEFFEERNEQIRSADFALGTVPAAGYSDMEPDQREAVIRLAFAVTAERRAHAIDRALRLLSNEELK